ncbi:Uncharacterized protein SCF082_LOCUS10586 [Durusdinium trenchii]|uniref:Uncharacterized protein n=1 Tax=Durusdinium trenchii TaxID=1381693 RepID=A0ABP0J7A5_9DINO
MPAEAVPESEDKSDLLDSYCKECFASGEGRLISSLVAIEEQHRAMFLLQTRLRNLIAEVMVRRVISRRRFKSSGSDDAHTMVCLQELVRDQDWIMLTETEHPATRSARPQSVVKEKRLLVAQLFDYLSIRGPRGERQVYWSGIAKLYRDAHLSCPCLFLPKAAAQRIFRQVLDAEPEALEASVTLHAKILHMEVPNLQESEDTSWQDYGLSLYGFVRYLLRIALHREDMAQQTGATAVSLTRSLRELFGSHLQKVQLNAKQDQFTLSARIVEVHQLQLSWEPFLRAVFALYAEQGHICNRPEEELRMGEDSLVNLLSDANLLGATLSRASTRSVYQSMANRRHFTSVSSKFCFRGQAEVRRRGRKGKRARSMPPQLKGAQPYFAELTAVDSLHFEDFQEVCLALAMYRNPNLVVPMELRLEEFLTAMVDGLKHRIFRTAEMPEHLVVEVKSEEADAKQRAWEELLDALEDCGQANVPSEIWRRRRRFMMQHPQEEEADTDNGSTRRSSSAPPSISVPSKLQKALQMARDSSESAVSVLSALKPSEGSLDGLGLPTGSRLESITSVMRAAKRFGAEINVAELKKKRSEIGKEALHRRRKLATIKVRFLADRQIRAAISANAASGIGT